MPVKTKSPTRWQIKPADLPPPYASHSANSHPHSGPRPSGAALFVPPGFQIAEWTAGLVNPRWLAVAPNGVVLVAESEAERVSVRRPAANGGPPKVRAHFATGLRQPFGIAFYPPGPNPTAIYIANTDSVVRFPYRRGDLKARGSGRLLIRLPGGG